MSGSASRVSRLLNTPFVRDYGMLFVLALLIALFSVLTINDQSPTGADAGKQVADEILRDVGDGASVLIVTRKTDEDRAFAEAVRERLTAAGADVLAHAAGTPAEAVRAIKQTINAGQTIDAIATVEATAKWTIYNNFDSVGAEKCVTPQSYRWPDFLKVSNLLGVANQTSIYAIIAIGMTMVILTAGIDLSVGSLVALAAISSAIVIRDYGGGYDARLGYVLLGVAVGVALCAIAGAFNGVMVTVFDIPPFITTLGMMMIASGLSFRLAEGRSIPELPAAFFWIGRESTLGIPNPVLLMIVLYAVAHFVMSKTVFGRYVYAIGGNEEAARLSGVPVKSVLLVVYTLCGALAGLGGIVVASQLSAGDPKYGLMYELDVIASVVVGGTSLMGGRGKILGTLIGAFIITVIKNGMNLTNVDSYNQKIVLGAVLTAAVLLDTLKRRGSSGS